MVPVAAADGGPGDGPSRQAEGGREVTAREFDLRAVVRHVLRTSPSTDFTVIAQEVFTSIPPNHRGEALRQALRPLISEMASFERMNKRPQVPASAMRSGRQIPADDALPFVGQRAQPESKMVRAIREDWSEQAEKIERALRNNIHVGGGQRKHLADCTVEDLMFAAVEREVIASRNTTLAKTCRALGELMKDHGAGVVGDLPVDVLAQVFVVEVSA